MQPYVCMAKTCNAAGSDLKVLRHIGSQPKLWQISNICMQCQVYMLALLVCMTSQQIQQGEVQH